MSFGDESDVDPAPREVRVRFSAGERAALRLVLWSTLDQAKAGFVALVPIEADPSTFTAVQKLLNAMEST